MSNNVQQDFLKTAFGELSVSEATPEVQINAVYGLRDDVDATSLGVGSSAAASDGNYVVQTGAAAGGSAAILSKRFVSYRSGQGLLCRISALFSTGVADSVQAAGLVSIEDALVFGYNGTDFGLFRFYAGESEIQSLQVTVGAGGAENATVTVDGTGYTVPLTAGTVQHNAIEIADSLTSQTETYKFSSNGDTVTAISIQTDTAGAFAFTSATAVAAWTQDNAAVAPTQDFTAQADWTNPLSWTLDPTKGNVYAISLQYLGYGGIRFYIENPETADLELAHVFDYANQNTTPSVSNPTFSVGWVVRNTTNTTNVTVKGASSFGGVEGKKIFDERTRGASGENVALAATEVNLLTIRNRDVFGGKNNKITMYPQNLIVSAAHNKTVIFKVDLNATFSTDLVYSYLDESSSVTEYSTDSATVSGSEREVAAFRIRDTTPAIIDISKLFELIDPGESLTISAQTSSGTGAEADASIAWLEDP